MGTAKGEIKIRKMTEADLQIVKEIDKELVGPHRSISWPLRIEAHFWVYRGLPNFVAEVEGEVAGFLVGDIRGAEYGTEVGGWIDMMGVMPRYKSKGIGRMLVEAFCGECQNRGVKVRVVVVGDDKRLVKFWTSVGFQKGSLVSYEK
jgi:ribosomal protein S18 acetylase RimI-like enzyme